MPVEIVQKVEKMVCCNACRVDQGIGGVLIGETYTQRLINKNSVAHYVPGTGEFLEAVFRDSDRSIFGVSTKLRACSRSSLEPENERHFRVFLSGSVFICGEHAIVHG